MDNNSNIGNESRIRKEKKLNTEKEIKNKMNNPAGKSMHKIAILRIRGVIGVRRKTRDAMKMLRLYKKNYCIIVENTNALKNILKEIKDYVTWGELDSDTLFKLLEKRGRLPGNKLLTEDYLKEKLKVNLKEMAENIMNNKSRLKDIPGFKLFFRLRPPIKGFERAGIKKSYAQGGVLGYRGKGINELLGRMI